MSDRFLAKAVVGVITAGKKQKKEKKNSGGKKRKKLCCSVMIRAMGSGQEGGRSFMICTVSKTYSSEPVNSGRQRQLTHKRLTIRNLLSTIHLKLSIYNDYDQYYTRKPEELAGVSDLRGGLWWFLWWGDGTLQY